MAKKNGRRELVYSPWRPYIAETLINSDQTLINFLEFHFVSELHQFGAQAVESFTSARWEPH